jgi:hypothetical protein
MDDAKSDFKKLMFKSFTLEILNWISFSYNLILKNAVFWDVTPCGSCKNRRLRGMYRLHHQDENSELGTLAVNVPSSPILFTLMM